jgi:hypothetical protein
MRLRQGRLVIVAGIERKPAAPTREHLLAHDRIVRTLAAACAAILPARFGTVAESARTLKRELQDRAKQLNRTLDLVTGCVQMTLRLHPVATAKQIKRTSGRRYLQALCGALPERSPQVTALRQAVEPLVRAERVRADVQGIAVYHLIEASDVLEYRRRAQAPVSGPFPPYAFALFNPTTSDDDLYSS